MNKYKYVLGLCFGLILAGTLSVFSANAQTTQYLFYRDLTVGYTGTDVMMLQKFLNSKGYLVASVGAGSPGMETQYFGPLTRSAVSRYQAANGIYPIAGYFGPITRAHVNAAPGPNLNPSPNDDDELSGGDGDFRDFDVLGSPNNENIEEGSEEEVLAFEFEADDSDLRLERLDVQVTGDGNTEKPWRYIDSLILYDEDHDEITSIDASDEDNWDEQEDDVYEITFDDIDEIVREGDDARFYIAVEAGSVDDDDLPVDFMIFISDDGLRAVNAEGINIYEGNENDDKSFTIETPDEGELDISVDENDNEDRVIEVEEDDDTEDVRLYTAVVESNDGDNEIEEVTVTLSSINSTVLSDMIGTLYLYIDGDEVGSESVDAATTDSVTFEDIDMVIDEDEEVDVEVRADVNEQEDNYDNGDGVKVTGISIDFVDNNDDDQTVADSTDGGEVTFNVNAVMVDTDGDHPSAIAPLSNDEARGRFFVEFTVTAPQNETIYIPKGATTSTSVASGQGAEFVVVDGNGNTVSADTNASSNLLVRVSGGSETGNYYKITDGNTATFRLDVIVDNDSASSARILGIQLTGLNYNPGSASTATIQYTAGLDEDYRSDTAYLLNENTSN